MSKSIYFTLLSSVLLLLLASCQPQTTDGPAAVVEGVSNTDGTESVSTVQIIIPANDLQIGTPRVPFILMDGPSQVNSAKSIEITLFDLSGTEPTPIWTGAATNFSDYVVPYWVISPPISDPGNYGFQAAVLLEDDSTTTSNFAVAFAEKAEAPAVGDPAIPSQNRTSDDGFSLEELSSDPAPRDSLYAEKLEDLVTNGRPTVIAFNTPAYCQTAICAPVLQSIKDVQDEFAEEVDFTHVEIYKEFNPLVVSDTISEWSLQSEPWTYVVDGDGTIQARLAGPVSPQELSNSLEAILNQ